MFSFLAPQVMCNIYMPLGPSIKSSCFPNMVLEPRFRSPDAATRPYDRFFFFLHLYRPVGRSHLLRRSHLAGRCCSCPLGKPTGPGRCSGRYSQTDDGCLSRSGPSPSVRSARSTSKKALLHVQARMYSSSSLRVALLQLQASRLYRCHGLSRF